MFRVHRSTVHLQESIMTLIEQTEIVQFIIPET